MTEQSFAANKHGWTTIVVIAYILAWVAGFFTVAALYGTHGWLFPVVAFAPIVGPVFLAEAAGVA